MREEIVDDTAQHIGHHRLDDEAIHTQRLARFSIFHPPGDRYDARPNAVQPFDPCAQQGQ